MNNTIDTEVVEEPNTSIAVRETSPPPALFGTSDPAEIVNKARVVANTLKGVIKAQGLISVISGKEYPKCEAWTLLGTMLGVFPVLVWTRKLENGWEARVEAKTRDGSVVGAAEAECLRTERNWSNRDDFALRSMAQTRATAKCLRMPLGFVMTLSGVEPTPAEEMVHDMPPKSSAKAPPTHQKPKDHHPATPAQPAANGPKEATEATKKWFLKEVSDIQQDALQFFIELGVILPNETLEDIPLSKIPTSRTALAALRENIAKFKATGKAEKPKANDESWRQFIVPIPHIGQKRDEYLKNPETIGQLFDARHNDEAARARLFGFYANFTPKPWKGNDGKERPPSDSDKKFRQALDLFGEWFEKNHPDEVPDE